MKNIIYDEIIIFGSETNGIFAELIELCEGAEQFEVSFGLDISCGDGLFLSDIDEDAGLSEKYDGHVCTKSAPRYSDTKKLLDFGRKYRFTVTNPDYSTYMRDCVCYINGQMVN